MSEEDVIVVGAGMAGLTAATFTARGNLSTRVISAGEPILRRNAHLENYPGFPAGVNPRLLLDMTRDQAERNGVAFQEGRVERVTETDEGFAVHTADGERVRTRYVVAASWSDPSYLADLPIDMISRGSKEFVDVDEYGRTAVDGLYAAGRLARQYHQAVIAAGDGATVAVTLLDDDESPFYHDWVAPEGYFTGRGRDVPPGCEEIDEAERRRREDAAREALAEYVAAPHPDEPTMHPSVAEE